MPNSPEQTQPWQRNDKPIFSNCPPPQAWLKARLYCPCVILAQGRFQMWFNGSDQPPIDYTDCRIGYAESDNGFDWRMHPANPIITPDQAPWPTTMIATPWVLFDDERKLFEMWCCTAMPPAERHANGYAKDVRSTLAYATSRDGLEWDFHPQPLLEGIYAPCVRKEDGIYRMWVNDRSRPEDDHTVAYAHVYEYQSRDGLTWERLSEPAIVAGGNTTSCVYPRVLKLNDTWYMWHIGHLRETDGPPFELFCDTSGDGTNWTTNHSRPAYAASRNPARFDSRFVSTPCVVESGDNLLLYHAATNLTTSFNEFKGRSDGVGMHIAVATMRKQEL